MKSEELQEILRLHSMWLRGEDGGARADLSGADISGADLSGTNLSGADLRWADLRGVNLRLAGLSGADLSGANLSGADLRGAELRGANFSGADLSGADLSGADLRGANPSAAIDGAVCRMDFGGWSICVRATETSIGCQQHANKKWLAWSPNDVAYMHAGASDWWADHGEAIKAAIKCVMSKVAKEKEVA